ncbi:cytoskeleton-associated protein 2 [Pempheris klunzingeri]|uniref:cytoskeleton-associated protein 2 n=1 Tax=Pempheris klunzingeri TaxID=3127111 RepID=UPI0039804844
MDNVAVSRRNQTYKKGNKENAQPAHGSKPSVKRDKTSTIPFQLKSNKKEELLARNGPLKAKAKTVAPWSTSGEAPRKEKTAQRDGRGASADEVKLRQTHSQAFLSGQVVNHKKMVAEAPKPPTTVPSSKPAPGMYKGKIVQSKIGSIWKSSTTAGGAQLKPPAPKTESRRLGNVSKSRSKSVAELDGRGTLNPALKPSVARRPPAGFHSARPAARTVRATVTCTSSRNTNVAPTKGSGTQSLKPKIPVTDKKVNKPPVTSTLSQYRLTMESAEERRAKLAEWLTSKGKTFKRPALTGAAPPKTKVSAKPEALKPQSQSHVEPAAQRKPEPEPHLEEDEADPAAAAHCAGTQGAQLSTHSQTPVIMNTTLDLLEDSDADLPVEPQDRVDDVVVNLCDALDAMETPSRCNDDCSQVTDVCNDVEMDSKPQDECKKDDQKIDMPEDVGEQPKVEQVMEEEESDQEVGTDEEEESDQEVGTDEEVESDQEVGTDEEVENDEDEVVVKTTPQMEDASVVKYSVKTTPYLQSVKRTIEDEASTSTSRRKSNIKDLKFLTPVRRSCRIQRKSSRLPTMLVDHDPCISSLAELVKLDDDSNAYIYRKNPALLEELPDQPRP